MMRKLHIAQIIIVFDPYYSTVLCSAWWTRQLIFNHAAIKRKSRARAL